MPNIRNPISITGETATVKLSTTNATKILPQSTSTVPSNTVLKVNSIFAANIDATTSAEVSIYINNGSTYAYLAKEVVIPIGATQIISTKETYFYLPTGYYLSAIASGANQVDIIASYEELT